MLFILWVSLMFCVSEPLVQLNDDSMDVIALIFEYAFVCVGFCIKFYD